MGTVYRARDPVLDREVALKTVAPALLARKDTLQRFQREARAAARLQHPNVVVIYELGEHEGTLFIAMELLEGMDLAQALSQAGRFSLADRVRMLVDVCRGLDYAHKRGVVHRDVKPANVRVLRDGSVKIVDFGIARVADSTMTQTGLVLGTPSYIAPEILEGGRVDHRADMWAVGVILYEMLAGRRPYEAPTIASLVYRIVHEPPPPLDAARLGLPEGLVAVARRCLARDPGQRFQDLAEMALALEQATGLSSGAEAPLPAIARRRACEKNLDEARRLFSEDALEAALEAARRAQSLDASRPEVVALVEQIEERLQEAPTLAKAAPPVAAPAPPETVAGPPAAPLPAAETARPMPTPVLTELRLRGASVFRELATFGEPPASQASRLSPVGDLFATAGTDGSIRVWDLHSRTRVKVLRTEMHLRSGHDAKATTLAYAPDGRLLASGHVDGAVHLWDVDRAEEAPVRLRHEQMVCALDFSPDGAVLASGGMDSTLKLWDVGAALAGEARRELHRQPSPVTALTYGGGGSWIATGHTNRVLRVHDAATGRLLATLRGPEALVNVLCPAPDGRRLAAASHDRRIRFFDVATREQLFFVEGHRRLTTSLTFFSEGTHFATVGLDNAVHLWDLGTLEMVAALWGRAEESFLGVALYGAGDHIAVALADGRIRVWGPA
jgi:hypothetical protein